LERAGRRREKKRGSDFPIARTERLTAAGERLRERAASASASPPPCLCVDEMADIDDARFDDAEEEEKKAEQSLVSSGTATVPNGDAAANHTSSTALFPFISSPT
jgi:hypothetical protein